MALGELRFRDALPRWSELLTLAVVRGLASFAAYASGFRALSDDDYARITIAQRFASAPHFDPSGSSWLPGPFWIYGEAFSVLGRELWVAPGTAIALALCATFLVFAAARVLGLGRPGSLFAAALTALLPYSALLGLAAVPEVPCAALILFGAATLCRPNFELRLLGGGALAYACLSRYEAWPVALVFALYSLWDARKNPQLVFAVLWALFGAAAWLVIGHVEHGDALFFIARVTSYKRALGGEHGSLAARILEYPKLLVLAEPELSLLVVLALCSFWKSRAPRSERGYGRPLLALLASLSFLIAGSVQDGVPTHHAARVLLPIWFFGGALCGDAFELWSGRWQRGPGLAAFAGAAALALLGVAARPRLLPREGFADRSAELRVGIAAKTEPGLLVIDTPDYGYFAIEAAFGYPGRAIPLVDHDPRHAPSQDPFVSPEALNAVLQALGADSLVTTSAHAAVAAQICRERWHGPMFSLFECRSSPR